MIRSLTNEEAFALLYNWRLWARPEQLAPAGDWDIWLLLTGRAWGKTRSGAEWVHEQVWDHGCGRIALVGRTAADARDVMVIGESGLLASAHPARRPVYEPSKRRVTWPNGAFGTMYSAEEPDALRGPQHDAAWADELASWQYDQDTWDQLQFGLRLGSRPRAIVTTTPRPTKIIRELASSPTTAVTRGSTYENKANLAPSFIRRLLAKYEGTRLARQELHAEILSDNPAALWNREWIEETRVKAPPDLKRIVVAVDPAVTSNADSAETGIIVAGLGKDNHGYILADCSLVGTPAKWGSAVVKEYVDRAADRVIGEVNQGGDLVEANVRTAASSMKVQNLSYKAVRASRGKYTRAEPVAALYEQRRIHHVGNLALLEDQLCDWDPTGNQPSPDRLDALVWALSELMLGDLPASLIVPSNAGTALRLPSRGY